MKRLFGMGKQKEPIPTLSETSQKIGSRAEEIDNKIAALDRELAKYKEQLKNARSPAQKQRIKQQAVNVLKRKRMYEQQRENLYNSQFGLDQVAFAQETMNDNMTTLKAMKEAAKTLQKQTKKFNIDKMEELQDQMYDLMADVEEINEIMSRSYATPDDIDESELLDELDALEESIGEDDTYLDEITVPNKQPTTVPSTEKKEMSLEDEIGL